MFDFQKVTQLESFNSICVAYGVTAQIINSKRAEIVLEATRSRFLAAISVEQNRDLIEIHRQKLGILNDFIFWRNKWSTSIHVNIFAPTIKNIIGKYGSSLTFSEIEQREVIITLEGGTRGDFHCNNVEELHLNLSSGSWCRVAGTCEKIFLRSDSSSNLEVCCFSSVQGKETILKAVEPS